MRRLASAQPVSGKEDRVVRRRNPEQGGTDRLPDAILKSGTLPAMASGRDLPLPKMIRFVEIVISPVMEMAVGLAAFHCSLTDAARAEAAASIAVATSVSRRGRKFMYRLFRSSDSRRFPT